MARERVRSVLRIMATTCLCLVLVSFFSVQMRYNAALVGLLPVPQANAYEPGEGEQRMAPGSRATVLASYCSEVVASSDPQNPSGLTSTALTFDDSWFAHDSRTYNHELATACAVLSAIVNSESQFYGSVAGSVPYAEKTLGALGFENIRTESFALRSHVLDQIGALFAGSHDVAAYAFASKTLPGQNGSPDQTLIFVGVRGSYGIEWLSNFKMVGEGESAEGRDHQGFKMAEAEVMESLQGYAKEIGADPEHTKILVSGHSRGGAVANLLAADLDNASGTERALAPAQGVFAYTFASPSSTQCADRDNALYGNIFNVANASDIVPTLPSLSWGFGRYGTTVSLPDVTCADFSPLYEGMQQAFRTNTGFDNPCATADLEKLDEFGAEVAEAIPSLDSLMSPIGVVNAVQTVSQLDLASTLSSHYPDTYIAWMQSIDSDDLTFS
ncbi:lipase family protein [Raoultibacter phocaeensis]|uniref:lipase family protein n=1 Tax=Raoultibacter phocaeensis TaxID=2479841 RepID=UPI002102E5D2|nr:lipase family protein [Raoultibacter phocaeensis]